MRRPIDATRVHHPAIERISWALIVLTTICVPLTVSFAAKDGFRIPKELFFKASAIALAALVLCEWITEGKPGRGKHRSRQVFAVLTAATVWFGVTSVTSTNPALSIVAFENFAAGAAFFVAVYLAAQGRSLSILYLAFAPGLANALIAIAQRTGIWHPIRLSTGYTGRLATVALLGNPDDVGMFLLAPAVAAAALAVTSKRHRAAAVGIFLALSAGIAASETLSALIALCIGLFVLFLFVDRRVAVGAAVLSLLLGAFFLRFSPQRWSLTQSYVTSAFRGDIDPLLSGRLPAFLAAFQMFRERPLLGVGPGCFPYQYFDQQIAVEIAHPWLLNRNVSNFGEVHNEHLQFLAEGGLPAYVIFVAAFIVLGRVSVHGSRTGGLPTARFAQIAGLPLAIAVFILAFGTFPFHLAAPTMSILFLFAVTSAWSAYETP